MVIFRYFRRYGLRWAIFWCRIGVVLWAVLAFGLLIEISPNGWSVVAVIGMYATWQASEIIKKFSQPIVINTTKAAHMEISDSQFTLSEGNLDRAVDRLIEKERTYRTKSGAG